MASAWSRFAGRILLVLSGADLTAREFVDGLRTDPRWRGAETRRDVERCDLVAADHTFSHAVDREAMEGAMLRWLAAGFADRAGACRLQSPGVLMFMMTSVRVACGRGGAWTAGLCLAGALPAGAQAQSEGGACGQLKNAYGPFDYRTQRDKLKIVEDFHFNQAYRDTWSCRWDATSAATSTTRCARLRTTIGR